VDRPISVPPALVIDGIVDVTCRQLDAAGIETAHLVGNSLGGWVALELARCGRAQSVLALSPVGAWRSAADLTRLLVLFRIGARVARRSKTIRGLAANARARHVLLRAMAERADRLTPSQVDALFEDMAGCSVLTDLLAGARARGPIAAFDRIGCPVRIAWGTRDKMLPFMRCGAPMLGAVRGAELVLLPDVGHVPMIDVPTVTAHTILDFRDQVSV
jgi:pimeloyl-ACP methyl ester carboxylesterase